MGNKSVVVIMGILALLVCAGPGMVWAQKGPVKIGVITPMTGAAAAIGKDMVNGLNLYLEQNGQQIAGRRVEVIVEDSQGKPDVALTKLRKLVESDQVQVLVGETFAHIGYAMAPRVDEYKVPMLYPVIAADDLTQRKPAKWVVRTGWSSSQPSHPFGEWVYKTLGYKRVAGIAFDFGLCWGKGGGVQKNFLGGGGGVFSG